ncbi:MAG: ArsR family transcriptional regulator, arsenate/arsenite/antimonite-responsive transcriptional [Chloroflexota bacterium]|nr:ArsR family transcriptional regulator, arsenate/arsenite/antimonite-responsive transcriptional [Chloroflexota bacterium]
MTTADSPLATLQLFDRVKGCCKPVAPPLPDARAEELATLYKALADPTRVQIIHILAAAVDPICVCDFTAAFDLGQPTISHHLAKLREAGIVTSFKRGIWAFHQLNPEMSPAARSAIQLMR